MREEISNEEIAATRKIAETMGITIDALLQKRSNLYDELFAIMHKSLENRNLPSAIEAISEKLEIDQLKALILGELLLGAFHTFHKETNSRKPARPVDGGFAVVKESKHTH